MDENFNFLTNEYIEKPSEFVAAVNTMYDLFKDAITTNTGQNAVDNATCGSLITASLTGDIFSVLLCYLGRIVHAAASFSMEKAMNYLTDTIGIEVQYKFKPVEEDKQAGLVTGGASGTISPSTDTPSSTTPSTTATDEATIEATAVQICNGKKPASGAAQTIIDTWNKGPCLSNNMGNGYAVDIVHNPRTSVDNQTANQCSPAPTRFVELDLSCGVVRVVQP